MRLKEQLEKGKASVRTKIEHPFRVIKRQFEFVIVRSCRLAKNMTQQKTGFALSKLWVVLEELRVLDEKVHPAWPVFALKDRN